MPAPVIGAIARVALGAAMGGGGGGQATGAVTQGLDKLAGSAVNVTKAVGDLSGALVGQLMGPLQGIAALAGPVAQLVGLFNPGVVTQFTLALNDAMAVIGAGLVPVLQGLTILARAWGDAYAGLLPVIQPVFDAIGEFFAGVAQGIVPIVQSMAPFIQLFTDGLAQLLRWLAQGVAFLQGIVAEVIATVAALFGLTSHFKTGASSQGFAARQTRVTSVSQFADDLFASSAKNIYSRNTGQKNPAEVIAEIRTMIAAGQAVVAKIRDYVLDVVQFFQSIENVKVVINWWANKISAGGTGDARGATSFEETVKRLAGNKTTLPWG